MKAREQSDPGVPDMNKFNGKFENLFHAQQPGIRIKKRSQPAQLFFQLCSTSGNCVNFFTKFSILDKTRLGGMIFERGCFRCNADSFRQSIDCSVVRIEKYFKVWDCVNCWKNYSTPKFLVGITQ